MEETTQTSDTVRKITEDDKDGLLVSFLGHAAYFKIPDDENRKSIKEKLLASKEHRQEIKFTYDQNLNIRSIK